jgi:probable lipoprotein (TIGR04455 family)
VNARQLKVLVPAALTLAAAACSPVLSTRTRADYAEVDRTQTVRLAVAVAPLPAGQQDVGDLWSMMARKYINQHRDFIVVADRADAAIPGDVCGDRIDGVLLLAGRADRQGDEVGAAVHARLVRCRDRQEVWSAQAAGTWPTTDDDLVEARKYWVGQTADLVDPYVVASFRLLTATLETLPSPKITDAEQVREKIDLGE